MQWYPDEEAFVYDMQCINLLTIWLPKRQTTVKVPCGMCIACRANKKRDWTVRLMDEARDSNYSYFVTLTIDESHMLPSRRIYKKSLQRFIRALRDNHRYSCKRRINIRYFACGEYGEHTLRPHYHAVVYSEEHIQTDDFRKALSFGYVRVDSFNDSRAKYLCKYALKYDSRIDLPSRPFALMSRRPPLGLKFAKRFRQELVTFDGRIDKCTAPKIYLEKLLTAQERTVAKIARRKTFARSLGRTDLEPLIIKPITTEEEDRLALKASRRVEDAVAKHKLKRRGVL